MIQRPNLHPRETEIMNSRAFSSWNDEDYRQRNHTTTFNYEVGSQKEYFHALKFDSQHLDKYFERLSELI